MQYIYLYMKCISKNIITAINNNDKKRLKGYKYNKILSLLKIIAQNRDFV